MRIIVNLHSEFKKRCLILTIRWVKKRVRITIANCSWFQCFSTYILQNCLLQMQLILSDYIHINCINNIIHVACILILVSLKPIDVERSVCMITSRIYLKNINWYLHILLEIYSWLIIDNKLLLIIRLVWVLGWLWLFFLKCYYDIIKFTCSEVKSLSTP